MIRRVTSVLLIAVFIVLMLPMPVQGTAIAAEELRQQIRDTYRKALRLSNVESFDGWCGSLVSWQTYLLGIDTYRYGCDGKNQFDMYRSQGTTTGGYRVKSYPASQYTLREALNAITDAGKRDAYNILVGFQKTNTQEGGIYGHAVFIHGIVDGVVYYMECFTTAFGGGYWVEGAPINCSIDTFCSYYDNWTVFDGVAYFGVKTYADLCEAYPSCIIAMANKQTVLTEEPLDPGVNDGDAAAQVQIGMGEVIRITELLKTPGGHYWYAVKRGTQNGYVPAEDLTPMDMVSGNAVLENPKMPGVVRKGFGFVLGGTVRAEAGSLRQITVTVSSQSETGQTVHCTVQVPAQGKQYSLNTASVDRKMTFRKLPVGTYTLTVTAVVSSCVLKNGAITAREETVEVWNSEFRVVSDWGTYYTLSFDACGGQNTLSAISVPAGKTASTLSVPERFGYSFAGWYTKPQGGSLVTEETPVRKNMTVYARWNYDGAGDTGWVDTEAGWEYVKNGSTATGWFSSNGNLFYRDEQGKVPIGWSKIGDAWYYFSSFGAAYTGWLEQDGKLHYLLKNGAMARGWTQIGGKNYWFDGSGSMQTGWLTLSDGTYYLGEDGVRVVEDVTIDGKVYRFREDGRLLTGWISLDEKQMYLDENGNPVTGWYSVDGVACYFGSDGALYLKVDGAGMYGSLLSSEGMHRP